MVVVGTAVGRTIVENLQPFINNMFNSVEKKVQDRRPSQTGINCSENIVFKLFPRLPTQTSLFVLQMF